MDLGFGSNVLLIKGGSPKASSGKGGYFNSLLPKDLVTYGSSTIHTSSSSKTLSEMKHATAKMLPTNVGGSSRSSAMGFTSPAKSLFGVNRTEMTAKSSSNYSNGLSSSLPTPSALHSMEPPMGMLTRERRSSSLRDDCFQVSVLRNTGDAGQAGSSLRQIHSAGSLGVGPKKVRFSTNLVSFVPSSNTRQPPPHPLIPCIKGSAAAAAAAAAAVVRSQSTPPLSGASSTSTTAAENSAIGQLFSSVDVLGNLNGTNSSTSSRHNHSPLTLAQGQTSSAGNDYSMSGIAAGAPNGSEDPPNRPQSSSGVASDAAAPPRNLTANSSTLVPLPGTSRQSPTITPKKLLLEKTQEAPGSRSSSPFMNSSSASASSSSSPSSALDGGIASMTATGSAVITTTTETPVATITAKSITVGSFTTNTQTSIRFYANRVDFPLSNSPILFDKEKPTIVASSGLVLVSLLYSEMAGIAIAGTKLRFKMPRKFTSFSNNFDVDHTMLQFMLDLNSVVSSSIVKQKVMPLICPVMFGGSR